MSFIRVNEIRNKAIERLNNPFVNGGINLSPQVQNDVISNTECLLGFIIGLSNNLMKNEFELKSQYTYDSYFEKLLKADERIYCILDDSINFALKEQGE